MSPSVCPVPAPAYDDGCIIPCWSYNYSTWYVHLIFSSQNYNKFVLRSESTLSGSSRCFQSELPKCPYYPDKISLVSLSLPVSMDRYIHSLALRSSGMHSACSLNSAYDSWQILSYAGTSFSWKKPDMLAFWELL